MPNERSRMAILRDQERMKVLYELALIDAQEETIFDRLTRLASAAIGAPVSLVSMVGADYQFFKSLYGLPEPWASDRRTPLSHSFCQHVVETNAPLVVADAREVDFLRDNLAIPDLDVIGYLGMPLTMSDGKRLGSFCVIDSEPRTWDETEIAIMHEMSQIVTNEIDLRAQARLNRAFAAKLDDAHDAINQLADSLDPTVSKDQFLGDLRAARAKFDI